MDSPPVQARDAVEKHLHREPVCDAARESEKADGLDRQPHCGGTRAPHASRGQGQRVARALKGCTGGWRRGKRGLCRQWMQSLPGVPQPGGTAGAPPGCVNTGRTRLQHHPQGSRRGQWTHANFGRRCCCCRLARRRRRQSGAAVRAWCGGHAGCGKAGAQRRALPVVGTGARRANALHGVPG